MADVELSVPTNAELDDLIQKVIQRQEDQAEVLMSITTSLRESCLLREMEEMMTDESVVFSKRSVKWCEPTETPEESNNTYQKMLSVLAQCEMTMEKTAEVYDMHAKEQEHYEMLNRQIEQQIEKAYVQITDCKNELLTAKCVRRNRQEYDALAKVIQQHPDRQETMRKLEELDKELESNKETKQSLQSKLELRRKQFHLLVVSLHEMERMLQDDGLLDESTMDQS